MMHSLELQTSMNEVQPSRAVDVHRRAQLSLRERLALSQIRRRHSPMTESDLDMQRHRDDVRHEHKGDA